MIFRMLQRYFREKKVALKIKENVIFKRVKVLITLQNRYCINMKLRELKDGGGCWVKNIIE